MKQEEHVGHQRCLYTEPLPWAKNFLHIHTPATAQQFNLSTGYIKCWDSSWNIQNHFSLSREMWGGVSTDSYRHGVSHRTHKATIPARVRYGHRTIENARSFPKTIQRTLRHAEMPELARFMPQADGMRSLWIGTRAWVLGSFVKQDVQLDGKRTKYTAPQSSIETDDVAITSTPRCIQRSHSQGLGIYYASQCLAESRLEVLVRNLSISNTLARSNIRLLNVF